MQKRNGFTVVEVLVVIIVIAILSSIVIVVYGDIQKQTRDENRKASISILAHDLEQFYKDKGIYPPGCPQNPTAAPCNSSQITTNPVVGTSLISSTTTLTQLRQILPSIPDNFGDPRSKTATVFANNSQPITSDYKLFYAGGATNLNSTGTVTTDYATPAPKSCILRQTLAAGQVGSFIAGYFSEKDGQWVLYTGKEGVKMTLASGSDAICVINKL